MKHLTDKYHVMFRGNKDPQKQLFDIKEVPKRAYQLGLATLLTGIGLSVYDAILGLYPSSFLVACFCFSIMMFMLLKYNEAIADLPIFIISMVCCSVIGAALLEGLQSEQYLLFFPMLMAVPIILDLKQTRYRKTFVYIAIILFSFCVCILIGNELPHYEAFNIMQINRLAFVYRMLAILLTIVFAVSYIFFEKKYIHELKEQNNLIIEARTQFLATMGHELRTPLNGIIGTIDLLKKESNLNKQEEYIRILKYCSDHMLQQVNDILDFNKIEAEKLDLHPIIINLKELLTNIGLPFTADFREKGLELIIDIDPELDTLVMADDLRLTQILNNLFSNALKFTEEGYIKLKAVCKNKTNQQISVSFSIEDTGIGIDQENQEIIFESFQQVYNEQTKKFVGTGLGLTICVQLLNLMDSTLKLVSSKGNGSCFTFDLVLENAVALQLPEAATVSEEEDSRELSGIRILLVEDNPVNMMIAKKVLNGYKAMVTTAYNGQEALDLLAGNQSFNMVLMDLEMPVLSGYDAIYKMHELYPAIPAIAFTASLVDQEMFANLISSGFADCLLKPFEPKKLLASINKHLTRPSLTPAV